MRGFSTALSAASVLLAMHFGIASAAAQKIDALEGAGFQKRTRTENPPCAFTPSLSFLEDHTYASDPEAFASAAWFARAVQLDDLPRSKSWKMIPQQPVSIHDVNGGPFGLHATVLEFDQRILVMYRGTQDPIDYALNAVIYTTPGWTHALPGWVHTGFLSNFSLSWRRLEKLIGQLASTGKSVVFASHSLGGSMSQYAGWRLEKKGIRVERIYAFQSPNAGDSKFKRAFDEKFAQRAFNVLYGNDITPYIPPSKKVVTAFQEATTRPLAGLLGWVVRTANYAAIDGRLEISPEGELAQEHAESEAKFWKSYRTKSGGKGFPQGLTAASGFVSDHNIDKVMCALAAQIR